MSVEKNSPEKKSTVASIARKILLIFFFVIILTTVVALLICNFSYSEGNSSGVLLNFSKKGFVFKTYEGELNMGGMGNVPDVAQGNEKWRFSVTDQAIADTLMNLGGRKVSLHYKEIIKNMPWQGDTKYFVDKVSVIN